MIALAAVTAVMAACSSDSIDSADQQQGDGTDQLCKVRLRIIPASGQSTTTRAWQDTNATDDEMMNLWTVVAVHDDGDANDGKIAFIHVGVPGSTEREIDDMVEIAAGKYKFYSFGNIGPSWLNAEGFTSYLKSAKVIYDDGTMSEAFDYAYAPYDFYNVEQSAPATPSGKTATGVYNIIFDSSYNDGKFEVDDATVSIDGNGFAPTATSNGFYSKGIPMSNVQSATITNNTTIDLIVIRMLAKMELQVTNATGSDVTLESITLSDVTANSSDNGDSDNLKLLPSLTSGANTMDYVHKDIQPNLGSYAVQADYTYAVNKAIANGSTETVTFYVNESATPTNAEGLYYLTLKLANGTTSELRYALISNNATNEWNYIARNDYRVIPIVIDDLKFELIPYDFPPIGVYPVSVKEVDATEHVYDFEFHDYGHFHLLPTVTKGGAVVDFSASTPTGSGYKWTLIDNNWAKSWFTYAAFGDVSQTVNPGGFYRTGIGSTTADGDEEGQTPVWYINDGVAGPKWAPDAANYRPFIFGYIEDPESALASDKRVYHEMKIQVYNGTSAYRQMLYRFYMTLSADQMLYAPAMGTPAPRRSHHQKVD